MLEPIPQTGPDRLAAAAEAYVWHSFALNLELSPLGSANLPHFLADRYRFWRGSLQGIGIVLMATKQDDVSGSGDIVKHRDLARQQLGAPVVLLFDRAPPRLRKRLIDRKVAFLAPGAQVYVPELMLDLRERSSISAAKLGDSISPTTQMILLAALQGEELEQANLTTLADRFLISIMSVSRALDELEALQVAESRHLGRQRRLHLLLHGAELWRAVEVRLRSPVRKLRLVVGDLPWSEGQRAGPSALAIYTNLSHPRIERRAVAAHMWKRLAQEYRLETATIHDPDRIEVETWTYDPRMLARPTDNVVDPLSLYLSVRHDPDERIAQAAGQLLEQMNW